MFHTAICTHLQLQCDWIQIQKFPVSINNAPDASIYNVGFLIEALQQGKFERQGSILKISL